MPEINLEEIQKLLEDLTTNERVVDNDDGTKTVLLAKPVKHKGETVDKVTMRTPLGRDYREMDQEKGDLGKAFRLVSSLSGLPMAIIDAMDGDDALLCANVASSMSKKLQTLRRS